MPIIFPLTNMAGQGMRSGRQLAQPHLMRGYIPLPTLYLHISGVTKDSAGAVLGDCVVQLFRTINDAIIEETTSDANGIYSFATVALGTQYYVVAYKTGSPDVAGTTVNTLIGT